MSNRKCESELIELNARNGFWLKAIARLHITVVIGKRKLLPGKSITAFEVIDKLKQKAIKPFTSIKVIDTSLEALQLEGDLL
jgi:hypothetical protein